MAHVFDPATLHVCTRKGVGLPLDRAFDAVTDALAVAYPDHIETGPRDWIFNNAGGAMGTITLLHASLSEYLLFFGTPIGTGGHSGRYRCEVWDFVLAGEVWCYVEGDTERRVYKPGDAMDLGRAVAKGYRIPDAAWMLEDARGPVATMLPFGLADSFSSTLDLRAVWRTLRRYVALTLRSTLRGKL
jgi:hypothetical protein